MTQVQTKSQTQDTFEMCIKEFNLSEEIPYEALSYSEKIIIATCYRMAKGEEINFTDLEDILDEANLAKLGNLYMKLYMGA